MGDSGAVGVSARMVGVLGGSSTKHHASGIWWHPTSSWWSWHQKNKLGWPTIYDRVAIAKRTEEVSYMH